MSHRSLISAGLLAAVIATVALIGVPVAGQAPGATTSTFTVPKSTYTPPKTTLGRPGPAGRLREPQQRADGTAREPGREEDIYRSRKWLNARAWWRVVVLMETVRGTERSEACQAAAVARLENVGGYNGFWGETHGGVSDNRTSLIEDPPDGKIPPLTPEAPARYKKRISRERGPIALDTGVEDRYGRLTTYKHWLDFDILGRCIAAQTPTGQIGYNAARQIVQSPGWVLIAIERLNTRIIPLDGRPHLGPEHPELAGRFAGALGGQYPRRRDHELHQQTEWRWCRVKRRPRNPVRQHSSGRTLRAGEPEEDPLLRHARRSEDVDAALDLHAAVGEGPSGDRRRRQVQCRT